METPLEQDYRIMGACKYHYCFLNCKGCYRISLATKEEKQAAAKDLIEHRKKYLIKV